MNFYIVPRSQKIFKQYDGGIFSKNEVKVSIEAEYQKRFIPAIIPDESLNTFIFIWETLSESDTDLKETKI